MIKISGKADNPSTDNGFSNDILFFIQKRTSSDWKFFFLSSVLEE